MSSLSVLIIDDEKNIRKTLTIFMESRGHTVRSASTVRAALDEAARNRFDLALVDLRLGAQSGLELIPSLVKSFPWMKLVVITAYATIETAVEAIKLGATDYITKPFDFSRLDHVTTQVATLRDMEKRLAPSSATREQLFAELEIQTREPAMRRAIELARQVAASEAVVLIRGLSGTGKTVLARSIHLMSKRASAPFGVISCPSLHQELLESELFGHVKGAFTGAIRDNPGRISASEGGTLFFDEIGDLPLALQPKLLRFIQEREYERVGDQCSRRADVRIIAATNLDLEQAVAEGRFREDLYYRLNVVPIALPSLVERPLDIEPLAMSLLAFFNAEYHKSIEGFTAEVLGLFRSYAWPGNIRELRNVVERAVILCNDGMIDAALLPETLTAKKPLLRLGDPVSLDIIEEEHIRKVLAESSSLQDAATILGIDQATLWRKRKLLGIR